MGKLRDQLVAAQIAREAFEAQQAEFSLKESRSDRERSLAMLLLGFASFYLVVKFGFTQKLDAISDYMTYFFEVSLVAMTAFLLRPRFTFKTRWQTLALSSVALAAGFGVMKLAHTANVAVPLDLKSKETVFFLLIVAPVLEELVFRFMLWKSLERFMSPTIATSILFSYSHLHAIWFVPAEYDRFLIYQTIYTLPLAFACAWMVRRERSLVSAMLVHFLFNLGFYLAA